MPVPKLYPETVLVKFRPGALDRIDSALWEGEKRIDFIRLTLALEEARRRRISGESITQAEVQQREREVSSAYLRVRHMIRAGQSQNLPGTWARQATWLATIQSRYETYHADLKKAIERERQWSGTQERSSDYKFVLFDLFSDWLRELRELTKDVESIYRASTEPFYYTDHNLAAGIIKEYPDGRREEIDGSSGREQVVSSLPPA